MPCNYFSLSLSLSLWQRVVGLLLWLRGRPAGGDWILVILILAEQLALGEWVHLGHLVVVVYDLNILVVLVLLRELQLRHLILVDHDLARLRAVEEDSQKDYQPEHERECDDGGHELENEVHGFGSLHAHLIFDLPGHLADVVAVHASFIVFEDQEPRINIRLQSLYIIYLLIRIFDQFFRSGQFVFDFRLQGREYLIRRILVGHQLSDVVADHVGDTGLGIAGQGPAVRRWESGCRVPGGQVSGLQVFVDDEADRASEVFVGWVSALEFGITCRAGSL